MFARRTNWDPKPNPLAVALERRRHKRLPILDLTESNPTRCAFEVDQKPIAEALAEGAGQGYEPDPKGLITAREAVCDYYAQQRATLHPDCVTLTTGTSESYSFALRLLADPGDEVLCPAPSYPLFDFLADVNDVQLIPYPLVYDHGWSIDLTVLGESITGRTRAIIVVSPNNPTGSFVRQEEQDAIIDLARRHDLAIIADEVFRDYAWSPSASRAATCASADGCLTLTLNGLSKVSALPQMKLGWMIVNGPKRLAEDALGKLEIIADTYLSVSTPIQHAARVLLDQRATLQPQILKRIRGNLEILDRLLGAGSPITRLQAEGGWYTVLRVPSTRSDEDWAIRLLETEGVYVHPGHLFDFSTEGHLVVSLITPASTMQAGVERLARHLRTTQ